MFLLVKYLLMEMHSQHSRLQKLPHDFFQHNIPLRWHATISTVLVLFSLSQNENLLVQFGFHQKTRCAHVSIAQWAPSDHLMETHLNFVEDLSPLSIVDTSPPKDEDYVSRRSRLIDLIQYCNFLGCKVHKIHTRDA